MHEARTPLEYEVRARQHHARLEILIRGLDYE